MIEKDLDKVLNYMKQYVENIYKHDSEPMLNWKDLKLVLEEIERLHSIIKEVGEEIKIYEEQSNDGVTNELDNYVFVQRLKKVLDKENKE